MELQEGDVLVCQCDHCDAELTVTKACEAGECGSCMDVTLQCCGVEMAKKPA